MQAAPVSPLLDEFDSLDAFHRAFHQEIRQVIDDLPLRPGNHVLDAPCGDGYYTRLLAERLGSSGQVVGVDLEEEALARASGDTPPLVEWVRADATALPFDDDSFDLAWCAQSLISLPDPVAALRELGRVVRPGGTVAILEEDSFHQLLLPWPIELELVIQEAIRRIAPRTYGKAGKLYVGRRLGKLLRAAGLKSDRKTTYAWDRQGPLRDDDRRYLEGYLAWLRDHIAAEIPSDQRDLFDVLTSPDSERYLPDRADVEFTYLGMVSLGRKPSGTRKPT